MARSVQESTKRERKGGAWMARLAEHTNLDLRVMSSSPMLGVEIIQTHTK